jgi:hypothetical protein
VPVTTGAVMPKEESDVAAGRRLASVVPGAQRMGGRRCGLRRRDDDHGGDFQGLAGLIAIVNNEFFVATRDYLFKFDVTTWGWIHLVLGIVIGLAGFSLLSGALWARAVGITLAVLSAIANFLFIPYYPFWSLLIIALDVFAIWALASFSREAAI